jgi:hypothetical protein
MTSKGNKMKTNRITQTLLALLLLGSVLAASATTSITFHGSLTNSLDTNAVIEIGAHLTGASVNAGLAPFDGHGFITPADRNTTAPFALATCRFPLSGVWSDGTIYFLGTVHSSQDAQLVGARFQLEVVVTRTLDGGFAGDVRLLFDTDPEHPQVGGHLTPLEYNGIVSLEFHQTRKDQVITTQPNE